MSSALYPHSFSHGTKLIGTSAGGTSADLVTAALLHRLLRLSLPLPLPGSSLHSRSFSNSPWPTVLQLDSPLLALPGGHFPLVSALPSCLLQPWPSVCRCLEPDECLCVCVSPLCFSNFRHEIAHLVRPSSAFQ